MIADMKANKKLSSIISELFLRGRKLNILLLSISKFYFKMLKDLTLNVTHYFIMKISNRIQIQQIASKHLSDIEFKIS